MIWHVCNSNHINVSNPTCCFLLNIVTHYIYFSNVVTHYINFSIVVTHSVRVHDVFQRFYVFCLNIVTHYIHFSNVVTHYIHFSNVVTHSVWFCLAMFVVIVSENSLRPDTAKALFHTPAQTVDHLS